MSRFRLSVINLILLLAVLGSRWAVSVESAPLKPGDFLRPLSLPYQGWKTNDYALTALERDVLQPDSVLMRRYQSPGGEWVDLAVIAGSQKRTVHTPGYCMPGSGWETLSQESVDLDLAGRIVPATRALMMDDKGHRMVATYFFTDGDFATRSLILFQGRQLLKRIKGEPPLGALVRVLVSVRRDPASAAKVADRFAQATLPPAMESLSRARSQVR